MNAEVTVEGVKFHVPSTGEMTLGEWRWVKQETGLKMMEFETALGESDPDAWWALVAVGARRDSVDLEIVDGANLLEIIEAIQAAADAEEEGPGGNAEGGESPANGSAGQGGPSRVTTLAGSGTPSSQPSSVSIPG